MSKTVTIFGSSIPRPGDKEYEIAYSLGKVLGENKINVCSGGYNGIMDAVSKGASESGADAIGVTVDIFNSTPGKFLTKKVECRTLFERISKLVELGDAYIILDGGTGTMLELSVVWEYLNKGLIFEKPVAALGKMWNGIIEIMERRIKSENRKTGLVKCFNSVDEIAEFIIRALK